MNTSTIPASSSTPIIKLTGPNGGGAGYQVGNLLILSGYGYKPLSGDGPSGFSVDFGLVNLRTLPAIQEPEQQTAKEKLAIYYLDLPKWTWDGCSSPMCSSMRHGYVEQDMVTADAGYVAIWKCRKCSALHRPY